jgi:hypothetical protein
MWEVYHGALLSFLLAFCLHIFPGETESDIFPGADASGASRRAAKVTAPFGAGEAERSTPLVSFLVFSWAGLTERAPRYAGASA